MSLILICLAIMGVLMFLSIVSGNVFTGVATDVNVNSNAIVNGSLTQFEITNTNVVFAINDVEGFILMIIVIGTVITALSLTVVGTGLSDSGVSTMRAVLIYTGLWLALTVFTYDLIVSIEIFGTLIYVGLTLVYCIGVFQKMGE